MPLHARILLIVLQWLDDVLWPPHRMTVAKWREYASDSVHVVHNRIKRRYSYQ